ncbi:MAG: substrate-binding domain-containing protein [Planctomycetaceae bacterium]|nr:substrate-binding domain-containing protein [Planctomycetaceae bacterium]
MQRPVVVMIVLLALLAGLIVLLPDSRPQKLVNDGARVGSDAPLVVYCAASNRAVMEAVLSDYKTDYGVTVQVQFGASQSLLSAAEISGTGDLFVPADDSYLTLGRERELLAETLPLAEMQAVVAVRKDAAFTLSRLSDLLQPGIRLVQANPDAAAIGKLTRDRLTTSNQWEALAAATTSFKGTVNEVANDLKVGAADAGIVFEAVLHSHPDLQRVDLPELADIRAQVGVGVLTKSSQAARALHLARYLAAPEKGLRRYAEFGFRPVEGDAWADTPELTLYAGSMLRPAIEQTLTQFELREGVRITRVYNGCGILVAQMQAGTVPDAYFACDVEFMNQVRELFPEPDNVSRNELVILVPKGNPRRLQTLKDLGRDGLRVGIGHEKQCAMGWLTQRTLVEGGVQTEVMQNVTVQTPTGDMLVNQMRAGSLDAAVAYLSNAAGSAEFLDAIRIPDLKCAVATQPYGIAEQSKHPHLAQRLRERLMSVDSRAAFEAHGFQWFAVDGGVAK